MLTPGTRTVASSASATPNDDRSTLPSANKPVGNGALRFNPPTAGRVERDGFPGVGRLKRDERQQRRDRECDASLHDASPLEVAVHMT